MRRTSDLSTAALTIVIALMCALVPSAAIAQDDNGTGGGSTPGQELRLSPADRARLDAKLAEASALLTSRSLAPAPTKVLAVDHIAQITSYYCGPAAGVMIARYKRMGASAYDGSALNQRSMAGPGHMRTDANGRTSFTTGLFAEGLNRWRGGTFFQQLANPSDSAFRNAFLTDIGAHSMPLAVSTIEFSNGVHYNYHPVDQTIGHWIVGRGFDDYGDRVHLVDPASGASSLSSSWSRAKPYFSAPSATFNQRHVSYGDHGLAW